MSDPTATLTPPEMPGGALARLLNRLALWLAIIGGVGTMGIMALINADVIGRGAFNAPVPATAEIVSAAIVAIVFLQLPQATAAGRNVRSDMLLSRLRLRAPRSANWLDAAHHLAATIMLAILMRYIGPEILESIEGHETVGLYGIFTMPRWPFVTCVLIGCALTLAQFAMLTIGLVLNAMRKDPTP
ncbi:TRAP transporter small permease [Pseudooceanicola sp.]|uniref:TRAP transporter small permease subunit n=1 Tax=Pseudooceanicola sp. TaxID=1914328 RepID=UPI00262A295D|nr:TRAP transporter small permease [Pseudooceanicola sp.]MDF1854066.1 TRAP transporter small permease [Pseudooceanicola sp.]